MDEEGKEAADVAESLHGDAHAGEALPQAL
jgi:hypothetical protein